jgi:hypothetical protein
VGTFTGENYVKHLSACVATNRHYHWEAPFHRHSSFIRTTRNASVIIRIRRKTSFGVMEGAIRCFTDLDGGEQTALL